VAAALQNQPGYTGLAIFDRYLRLANEAAENKVDRARMEVAFVGGRELYSWPGESTFSDTPLTGMVAQGLIGDGTFAAQARNIFVGNLGSETYLSDEPENGRWNWAYQIPVAQKLGRYRKQKREKHRNNRWAPRAHSGSTQGRSTWCAWRHVLPAY
jgi:hypothetical protein